MKCLPERGLADVPSPPDTGSCGRSTEGGRTTALKDPIKNLNIVNQSNEHLKFVLPGASINCETNSNKQV